MFVSLKQVENLYQSLPSIHSNMRKKLGRALTLTEKILFSHLDDYLNAEIVPSVSDLKLRPDHVAMQDATAQMALLQFMIAGLPQTQVPTTVHCDHLIVAQKGAQKDLQNALISHKEIYDFLESASNCYGIGFWKPGSGIIHQVILENYAVPGMMMIGTDSHTPNAGGLAMIAIGVGGADAVDVMTQQPFQVRCPSLIGVHLKGKLSNWTAPKDIIIKLLQMISVKGGTGHIIEYFGPGTQNISCTGKATITNMGAELGATTSVFPFDQSMALYLKATQRQPIAELAQKYSQFLSQDPQVIQNPEKYYSQIYEIDLSSLEPQIAGPDSPDRVRSIHKLSEDVRQSQYPDSLSAALVGSCTNSSYEDLSRVIHIVRQAIKKGLTIKIPFLINPGSEQIFQTLKKDSILQDLEKVGATILSNACGACIGQWNRPKQDHQNSNNILSSFNRNFKKRNDGSPLTNSFIASPEIVTAMAFSGDMHFNPMKDSLLDSHQKLFRFSPPSGSQVPPDGFVHQNHGYSHPSGQGKIKINPKSERLALLKPFPSPSIPKDFQNLRILFKAHGKCTTDHVSPAGPWLKYRGHLDKISDNLYLGAYNDFTNQVGIGKNILENLKEQPLHSVARAYQKAQISWIVVADENYGEGSSREHAAMEPRYLGGRVIIAKSFARIAESNLKKQGMLPLWLDDHNHYSLFQQEDIISIPEIQNITPQKKLLVHIQHRDGNEDQILVSHTLNQVQIQWIFAGSALNFLKITQNHIQSSTPSSS